MLYEPDPGHLMIHMGSLDDAADYVALSFEEGYDVWQYNEACIEAAEREARYASMEISLSGSYEKVSTMKVSIHVDGACSGNGTNSAIAGCAAILVAHRSDGTVAKEVTITGSVPGEQTNNRAEIQAVILGLSALKTQNVEVAVHTDSNYVFGTMTENWKRKTNKDLWDALDAIKKHHQVTFVKVAGHAGHQYNEAADKAAKNACR